MMPLGDRTPMTSRRGRRPASGRREQKTTPTSSPPPPALRAERRHTGYRRPLTYVAAILAAAALVVSYGWMAQRRTSDLAGGRDNVGPTPAPTPAMLATVSPTTAPSWTLSSESRAQLLASLSTQQAGTPAWIVYDSRYPSAEALARQLAAIFEEAHWSVRPLARAGFALRPGLFLFAADDPPSASSAAVSDALSAAKFTPTIGSGYRAYVEEHRRADPNWHGISFAPHQTCAPAGARPPAPSPVRWGRWSVVCSKSNPTPHHRPLSPSYAASASGRAASSSLASSSRKMRGSRITLSTMRMSGISSASCAPASCPALCPRRA